MNKKISLRSLVSLACALLCCASLQANVTVSKELLLKKLNLSQTAKTNTKFLAAKTYDGLSFKPKEITSLSKSDRALIKKILSSPQIELNSGKILYPEEIKSFQIKSINRNLGDQFGEIIFRPPHE